MRRPPKRPYGKVKSRAGTHIIDLPVGARQRDGIVGLFPALSPGELVVAVVAQLEREARLCTLAGSPNEYLNHFAVWLRAGGRHEPVRWEATA